MPKKSKLYIIHGWTYTTTPWTKTIALLEKRGFEIEMLNVPGLTSPSKKVWTIEDYVKWADRSIPDGSVALGHSNGGRILLNLCIEKPEKIKHLILLDAAGVYEPSRKRDLMRKLSKRLGFLKKVPGVAKLWHKIAGATDYAKAPKNMKQTLSNMLDSDKNLDMSKVTVPTSILWGSADNVTPPRQAEVMYERIQNSDLKIFPGWTHAPYLSHPDALAKAIEQAYNNLPENRMPVEVANTSGLSSVSAAFAMKRAPEPVLDNKESNPVAPNVATKLVLRKDEKITDGLVVSDEEGAAVRYQPKVAEVQTKSTNATEVSASASMRRAEEKRKPDTNVTEISASANIKKAAGRKPSDVAAESASLAFKREEPTVDFEAIEVKEPAKPQEVISTSSVPKVSRLEQAKRKVGNVKNRKHKKGKRK